MCYAAQTAVLDCEKIAGPRNTFPATDSARYVFFQYFQLVISNTKTGPTFATKGANDSINPYLRKNNGFGHQYGKKHNRFG
jgi:hypothetical protein